jgi:hypothetical protein
LSRGVDVFEKAGMYRTVLGSKGVLLVALGFQGLIWMKY